MSIRSIKAAAALGYSVQGIKQQKEEEKGKNEKCEDFDDLLEIVGSQNAYQKFLLYVVLCPITAIEPILALNILFMLYEPDHWCSVPGRPDGTALEAWKNLTIPREEDGTFSKCEMFTANSSRTACTFGWEYDMADYKLTIPSEFNWVCEKSEWATWSLTVACIGNAFGTIFYGMAADKIGRKPIFFLCLFLNVFGRIFSLFVASNFYAFLLFQFITGTGFPMIFIAPCMICAEMADKVFRAWIYSVTWMIWVVGMAALPFVAWLTGHWFYIGLITTMPFVLAFGFYNWIPESPRWLVSQGKVEEAAKIITEMATKNGTSDKISELKLNIILQSFAKKQEQGTGNKIGVWTLFMTPRLAVKTTLLTIAWVMNAVIYYAITLNASNLSGNQFINFFILAVIELPAGYLGSVLVDQAGRRWTQVAFFVLCALSSIVAGVASPYTHHNGGWAIASVVGAVVSKFAITLTFLVIYLQATEIFPTQLRSTGSGFTSTMGSIIGIFTPYIVYLSKYNLGAPWFIIGCMSIVGMVSSAFLPETLGQALPETLEDAENFGKGEKFWSIIPQPSSANDKNNETKSNI